MRSASIIVVGWLAIICGGCNSLPAGSLDAVRSNARLAREGHVYLLRGWNGLWSEGIDTLSRELTDKGIEAHVYQVDQSDDLGKALAETFRRTAPTEPLVLIGFSFGADEAIRVTRTLAGEGIAVDLLITIDPVTPPAIPSRVRRCSNFYQSNGAWDALPWLRGVPVSAEANATGQVTNLNLRDHAELQESRTGHDTIAGNEKLHREIISRVIEVCPPRPGLSPPAASR